MCTNNAIALSTIVEIVTNCYDAIRSWPPQCLEHNFHEALRDLVFLSTYLKQIGPATGGGRAEMRRRGVRGANAVRVG